ncbi:MAG TPA: hypothetical protein VHM31_13775 [Polyangia bacterium]|nr:hypothetical protein [Polyangia bacterium]
MRSDGPGRHTETKAWSARSIALAATALAIAVSVASCDSDSNQIGPPVGGGPAVVLRDGGAPDGGAAAGGKGGNGGRGGVGGSAGRNAAGAGGAAGARATGGAGGTVVSGTGGAANGGATQVDPCRACVQRRCTKPQNDDGTTQVAYDLCFLDQAVPAAAPNGGYDYRAGVCGDGSPNWDRVTVGGDHPGTSKAGLCKAVLDCIVRTKCAGDFGADNFFDCYCGPGKTAVCGSATFVPQGQCAAEMAAGYETTSNNAITNAFANACFASGAASYAYVGCYESCCSKECLGVDPPPGLDDGTCNAPSSAGTGGATGTGGMVGTGGILGTGGAAGRGGTTGTGGVASTSGSGGTVAAGGRGGSAGAASGGAGAAGAGGGAPAPMVSHFDGTTSPWLASYGATVSYSTFDAKGSAASGSLDLALTNGSASINSVVAATECVSAVANATYDLSAQVFLPQSMSGSLAGMALWFFTSNDCTGAAGSTFTSSQIATVASWQSLTASSTVPAGTQSMSIRLTVTKPAGKTDVEARFDDVSVTKH